VKHTIKTTPRPHIIIMFGTISKQDNHKPLGRLARSLVISDDMCSDFHYVSLTQNEYGGYIVNCILHYNEAVRSSPLGIDDYGIYGFHPSACCCIAH